MQSIYFKTFNHLDNFKPIHLGIYFSLFLHLSILLFAIGLPDFFKPKKIFVPHVIPIEILNISDVTSLTTKNESVKTESKETKKIKQKKFNSSENTEIQKIDLQEKTKKQVIKNENISKNDSMLQKSDSIKMPLKENQINKLEDQKTLKIDNADTIKVNKIKPKLKPKPKPIENKEPKSDLKIENQTREVIKKENEKKVIDSPKPIQKPEPEFNLATMLKDLRNEDTTNVSEDNTEEDNKLEVNEEDEEIVEANIELSISELDLVLQQLRSCFNPRAGTQIIGDEMVKIRATIDRQANVRKDTVQIVDTNISKSNPYYEAITESALATLHNPLCSQLKLPLDKYDTWKDLNITIDYSWIKN